MTSLAPTGPDPELGLSLADVLAFDEVLVGSPEMLTHHDPAQVRLSWLHVAGVDDLSSLLDGGELVLSAGRPVRGSLAGARRFLRTLAAAGAAAVLLELVEEDGSPALAAIGTARQVAAESPLPLAVVTRRIRFARVTQRGHRRLIDARSARLHRANQVHDTFTSLGVAEATAPALVEAAARLLSTPVVLEDLRSRVLAAADPAGGERALLEDWTERSHRQGLRASTGRSSPEGWLQTPVGVPGHSWGRLVCPLPVLDEEDARQVLERTAQALTIGRLAAQRGEDLAQSARTGLLQELRGPGEHPEDLARTRAQALGVTPTGTLIPLALRRDRGSADEDTEGSLRDRALLQTLVETAGHRGWGMLAMTLHPGLIGAVLALPEQAEPIAALDAMCEDLVEDGQDPAHWLIGWTRPTGRLTTAARALEDAAEVAQIGATIVPRTRRHVRAEDTRLRGLLARVGTGASWESFVRRELGPLREQHHAELRAFVEVLLAHGGSKAETARALRLSRPVIYDRIARAEAVLGHSLSDPESRTSLHVAMLWSRLHEAS